MNDDIQLGNPWALPLALLVIPVMALSVWAVWRRARLQRRWATPEMLPRLVPARVVWRDVAIAVGSALVVALLAIALADLRWGKTQQEVPQRGIEVVFLLDVSRSMLAQDVSPNRLLRAKQQIREMINEMAGDRVALVAFAGETKQIVPLTNHYDSFGQQLDEVSISTVRRGGSKLGDALQVASEAFLSKTNSHKAIVVFTDGEDQESEPVKIAGQLNEDQGIRVYTVGLGDMDQGARIPDADPDRPDRQPGRFIKYDGKPVWSKLNGSVLSEVATNSKGVYIPAGTRRVDMADLYRRTIARLPKSEFDRVKIDAYAVRFHWFALPALILLFIETLIRTGGLARLKSAKHATAIVIAFGVTGLSGTPLYAQQQDVQQIVMSQTLQAANDAYRESRYAEAIEQFKAVIASPNDQLALTARYNLGTTQYRLALAASQQPKAMEEALARVDESIRYLRLALRLDPDLEDARYNLERALLLKDRLQQQQEEEQRQQNVDQNQDEKQEGEEDNQQEQQPNQQQQPSEEQQQGNGQDPQQPPEGTSDQDSEGQQEQPSESSESSPEGEQQPQDSDSSESSEGDEQQSEMPEQAEPRPNTESELQPESSQPIDAMSQEEAMKLLQSVRDRDMIRRYRQRMRERTRHVDVEKDW